LCGDQDNLDPSSLRGHAMTDAIFLDMEEIDSKIAVFRLRQYEMMAAYVFKNWELVAKALSYFKYNEKMLFEAFAMDFSYVWAAICFYDLFLETGKNSYKTEGQRAYRRVKNWASSGTKILVAPHILLTAMDSVCRTGISSEQIELNFKAAIDACKVSKCTVFEAIGTERLARYFMEAGSNRNKGEEYRSQAIECYQMWGALCKENLLKDFIFSDK
jgi:hypothetical protein